MVDQKHKVKTVPNKSSNLDKENQKSSINSFLQWTVKPLIYLTVIFLIIWLAGSYLLLNLSNGKIYKTERSYGVDLSVNYKQIFVRNDNGDNLDMIYMNGYRKELVIYLHGNSGRVPHFFKQWRRLGYRVLSPAYPKYHLSEGDLNTQTIYQSAKLAYDWAMDNGYSPKDIIVFGHSLGGSPAVDLARHENDINRLILVNVFSSIQSMCWDQYYIFCLFSGNILNTYEIAGDVEVEVIQFAYKDDQSVPYKEGKKLYEAFPTDIPKRFVKLSSQTHSYFDMDIVMDTRVE